MYDYDQVSGQNFQVYYAQQAASFIMPQTGSAYGLIASPVAGLTNQQNWNTYGIAIAGAVAPSNATTMTGINGLVVTLPSGDVKTAVVTASQPAGSGGPDVTATQAVLTPAAAATPAATSIPMASTSPAMNTILSSGVAPSPQNASKSPVTTSTSQLRPGAVFAGPLAFSRARWNPVRQRADDQQSWPRSRSSE